MSNQRDILVATTNSIDGVAIQKYLKPVSAHVVAGTNLFSDFFADLSDVFGGRSGSYSKQLSSLYNEAIEQLKLSAFDLGANCILGLSIDIDEISGKGKSMFMITAVGTAVVIEKTENVKATKLGFKKERMTYDELKFMQTKMEVLKKIYSETLELSNENWSFLIENSVEEAFQYLLKRFQYFIVHDMDAAAKFEKRLMNYLEAFSFEVQVQLLYKHINSEDDLLARRLIGIARELKLYVYEEILTFMKSEDFAIQKRGLRLATCDARVYSLSDLNHLKAIKSFIFESFPERGERFMKKNMITSNEREMWACECGKSNEIASFCYGCNKGIHGFTEYEMYPEKAMKIIDEKICALEEYFKD